MRTRVRLPVSQLTVHVSAEGSRAGQHYLDEKSGVLLEEKTERYRSSGAQCMAGEWRRGVLGGGAHGGSGAAASGQAMQHFFFF